MHPNSRLFPARELVITVLLGALTGAAAGPSISGIGFLNVASPYSLATGVSADGSVVVGSSISMDYLGQACIWHRTTGIEGLGYLRAEDDGSDALAVSADGLVAVGQSLWWFDGSQTDFGRHALRWAGTSMDDMGLPYSDATTGPIYNSIALAASANGDVVVGRLGPESDVSGRAFCWVNSAAGGTYTVLSPATGYGSTATGVSEDGSLVVGYMATTPTVEAFLWRPGVAGVGVALLGDLDGGDYHSEANAISADGRVVVGWSSSESGDEAFRWTAANGIMVGLGDLPDGAVRSNARGVSANGSVIVGSVSDAYGHARAMIWDEAHGMRRLQDVLAEMGVDLTTEEWMNLLYATAVSPNGRYIVGTGQHDDGTREGFIVDLGDPDAAPEVTLCGDVTLSEGDVFECVGRVVATGPVDCLVNYGDSDDWPEVVVGEDGAFALQHVYCDEGVEPYYLVTVVATDAAGHEGTATMNVVVLNVSPTAEIVSVTPAFPVPGEPIAFVGASADPGCDESDTVVAWDFGDGAGASSLEATHTYASAGAYQVVLTVSDGDGGSGTDRVLVLVGDPFAWVRQIILYVRDLGLPRGTENSLVTKLERVLAALGRGNLAAATGPARAFSQEVRTPAITRRLTPEEAAALQRHADWLLAQLTRIAGR